MLRTLIGEVLTFSFKGILVRKPHSSSFIAKLMIRNSVETKMSKYLKTVTFKQDNTQIRLSCT